MTPAHTARSIRSLFEGAAPRYETVVRSATLGMDPLWKRRMFAAIPDDRSYDRILDLGCGTGIVTRGVAERYPSAEVVGVDLSPEMLAVARARTPYDHVSFLHLRVEDVDCLSSEAFDLLTGSFVPKYTAPDVLAENANWILAERGVAIFHDFVYPRWLLYRAGFDAYWVLLSRVLTRLTGYERIAAELRTAIVAAEDWPEQLATELERAGFDRTTVAWQPFEIAAIVTASREGVR